MSVAVFRAAGAGFDSVKFVAAHRIVCDAVWRAGDADRRGRISTTSGFNALVAKCGTPSELGLASAVWMREHQIMLASLAEAGAEARLDLALFVGGGRPAVSVTFGQELLGLCVQLGVALEVSAYATSDESGNAV
jgi:hypothetical protein